MKICYEYDMKYENDSSCVNISHVRVITYLRQRLIIMNHSSCLRQSFILA